MCVHACVCVHGGGGSRGCLAIFCCCGSCFLATSSIFVNTYILICFKMNFKCMY